LPDPPARPEGLTGAAAAVWDHYGALLTRLNVLSKADGLALEILCRVYADLREVELRIEREGITTTDGDTAGDVKLNPLVRKRDRLREALRASLRDFGLTPESRIRVAVIPEPDQGIVPFRPPTPRRRD
jgi:P27 family predicted phage terminase small subunit